LPIFEASQLGAPKALTYTDFKTSLANDLKIDLKNNPSMLNLGFFDPDGVDFSEVTYSSQSENLWTITPPAKANLIDDLNSTDEVMLFYVEYTFSRVSLDDSATDFPTTSTGSTSIELDNKARQDLIKVLDSNNTSENVTIQVVIPSVYYIQDTGKVDNETVTDNRATEWYTISLNLSRSEDPNYIGLNWWNLGTSRKPKSKIFDKQFSIYVVMDKVVPDMYSSLASYGILGLYTAFVLLVSNLVKGMFTGFAAKIMWEEIPDVTVLQTLTKEIYLCRETDNLALEEDLYAQLQYLYRSPEVMIKNTKLKLD